MLFEGSLDVMEDIKDMVLLGPEIFCEYSTSNKNHKRVPPWAKARREVENPILADQWMEYVRHKLDHRLVFGIVYGKGQPKFQDCIGIVA
jgi:hypothetical protein